MQQFGEPPGSKIIAFPDNKVQLVILPKLLGKGQFGTVNLGYTRNNPDQIFAVKTVQRSRLTKKTHQLLLNEMAIMSEIMHPNVISQSAGQKTANNYYLVLEYCNGGNL